MSSPGQKRGSCGHAMAIFDGHAYCARCREKGKGEEPCIANKETLDCTICNSLTPEQRTQLATPSYKIKKEKREAKRLDEVALVDPDTVSVIGVVGESSSAQTSSAPPEKKPKKDKAPTKGKKSVEVSSTDSKISFDGHAYCARCREKGKGEEPCIANKETLDCTICNSLTPEQRTQLATPSYKIKKEKREAKRLDEVALVDPDTVSVIGVVGESSSAQTSSAPPEKKPKKDKAPTKGKKSVEVSSTDSKISQLDDKWSERFPSPSSRLFLLRFV